MIGFHLQHMIEDLGAVCTGVVDSFADLQARPVDFDAALVDIDLADGPTGPAAAEWLASRGVPSVFVTGQIDIAGQLEGVAVGVVAKPVADDAMARALGALSRAVNEAVAPARAKSSAPGA